MLDLGLPIESNFSFLKKYRNFSIYSLLEYLDVMKLIMVNSAESNSTMC